jgi:hypothetical protein
MRLISQDGSFDCLYDNVEIMIDGGRIYVMRSNSKSIVFVASYPSKEIAKKVVDALHNAYMLMNTAVFRFPIDGDACK